MVALIESLEDFVTKFLIEKFTLTVLTLTLTKERKQRKELNYY